MLLLFLVLINLVLTSCESGKASKSKESSQQKSLSTQRKENTITMVSPKNGDTIVLGELCNVVLKYKHNALPDSLSLFIDNKNVSYEGDFQNFHFTLSPNQVGKTIIKVVAYYSDGNTVTVPKSITVLPKKAPSVCTYELVKRRTHDVSSYTQGLFYKDGILYEGTGQYGHSALYRTELSTGKVLNSYTLNARYFGEGITLLNDKIYQLTWQSGKAFVYDAKSLEPQGEYDYYTEGWGITTKEDKLIMSDGSNKLYFIHPDGFTVERQIEVFSNSGPLEKINELEYVNGIIWANVWLTDNIVGIDPSTGIVKYTLDLSQLLAKNEKAKLDTEDQVLNGIAYNAEKRTFYVTGKNWPYLFEIKINCNE